MKCCKKPNNLNRWFLAAQEGDILYIKANKNKYASSVDREQSKGNRAQIIGFTALLYAILHSHYNVIEELLQAELLISPETEVRVLINK